MRIKALIGTGATPPEKVSSSQLDSHTMDQLKSLGTSGLLPARIRTEWKGVDPKDRLATLLRSDRFGPDSARIPAARRSNAAADADVDPHNPSLYFYLGAEYEKAGHYDQAIQVTRERQNRAF